MSKKEIPVYLFTGFLDAGKTTFIQETLEDPGFNDGQKTLLIVTEEGEVEYQPIKFASSNVKIMTLEDEEELTESWMTNAAALCNAEKVVIEYNGMWVLDQLYNNLPENWTVYQEMTFADARNFVSYNDIMRQLVYDKVNIEDPLPFDMNAKVIEIQDQDYAMWYADMNDNEANYYGKTVKFKGRTLLGGGLKPDEFVIGRHIMTCCVQDIQFGGLVAKYPKASEMEHGGWVVMTAEIVREYNDMYEAIGPVFHVKEVVKCDPPEEEVATFY